MRIFPFLQTFFLYLQTCQLFAKKAKFDISGIRTIFALRKKSQTDASQQSHTHPYGGRHKPKQQKHDHYRNTKITHNGKEKTALRATQGRLRTDKDGTRLPGLQRQPAGQ